MSFKEVLSTVHEGNIIYEGIRTQPGTGIKVAKLAISPRKAHKKSEDPVWTDMEVE
jgi:hypothetical protein